MGGMRTRVWLTGLAVLLAVAATACDDDNGAAPASEPAGPVLDVDEVDPCTLLNRQQQEEIGGISLTQPIAPTAGFENGAACVYDHEQPVPSWSVILSVDPESVTRRPSENVLDEIIGEPAADGCVVRIEALGLESRYRTTDPAGEPQGCATAEFAAELAGQTMFRRLERENDQVGG